MCTINLRYSLSEANKAVISVKLRMPKTIGYLPRICICKMSSWALSIFYLTSFSFFFLVVSILIQQAEKFSYQQWAILHSIFPLSSSFALHCLFPLWDLPFSSSSWCWTPWFLEHFSTLKAFQCIPFQRSLYNLFDLQTTLPITHSNSWAWIHADQCFLCCTSLDTASSLHSVASGSFMREISWYDLW